jgi:hypothetical protein
MKTKNKITTKKIDTVIEDVFFRDIKETEINAQEMGQNDFNRLVKNIKTDGCLTSAPLLMKQNDKKGYICISGHHRIRAAIKAGLTKSKCIIIDEVDKSKRLRLQLSHNDINGTSNDEVLFLLQKELSNDDLLLVDVVEDIEIQEFDKIDYTPPVFKYINIALLEESREALVEIIMQLGDKKDDINYLVEKKDYEKLTDLLTFAFEKGFKSPGQALGKFIDIINDNRDLIKR